MNVRNDLLWLVGILAVIAVGFRLAGTPDNLAPVPPSSATAPEGVSIDARPPIRLGLAVSASADRGPVRTVYIPLSNIPPGMLARILRAASPDTEIKVVGRSLRVRAPYADLRAIAAACRRIDHPLDLEAWNATWVDAPPAGCGR